MLTDQYIVMAVYKDDGRKHEWVRLVTDDQDEAMGYDVSSYDDPHWNVYVEHVRLGGCIVQEHCGAQILFPDAQL